MKAAGVYRPRYPDESSFPSVDKLEMPISISDLDWNPSLSVLVLAPHPDDFDVIAVTLGFFLENRNRINAVVARGGSGVDDDYRAGLDRKGKARLREGEQRRSMRFFGLISEEIYFLNFQNGGDGQMIESSSNLSLMKSLLSGMRPDIVFLPHGDDSNSAHRAMYSLFSRACIGVEREICALLVCDPKTIDMRFDLYTSFGEAAAEWKARMLRFHDSQQQRNLRARGKGFDERILDVNREASAKLGIEQPYAEAFELERILPPASRPAARHPDHCLKNKEYKNGSQ